MARQFVGHFPKAPMVYRIEWRSGKPIAVQFNVVSRSTASVTLEDPKGKHHIVTGRKELQKFAGTIEEAVLIAFREICDQVSDDCQQSIESVQKALELAKLL